MNRTDYEEYVGAFNRGDFDGFSKHYTDDVVFELGDMRRLEGQGQIVEFYREVRAHVRETLTVLKLVIDDEGAAAEVETEFLALNDWPEFVSGPLKQGDVFKRRGLIMYDLRDGKFSYIRSARTRLLISPW